jgi:hypothetical protein
MIANMGRADRNKHRCDRCQEANGPVAECRFDFKHPFQYWKTLYESRTGNRLTRRRNLRLGEQWDFNWKTPPTFWTDLCASCWADCSQPWDGFPMEFFETVLRMPGGQ